MHHDKKNCIITKSKGTMLIKKIKTIKKTNWRDHFVRPVFNKVHQNRLKDHDIKSQREANLIIQNKKKSQSLNSHDFPLPNSPNRHGISNCLLSLRNVGQYSVRATASKKADIV